MQEFVRIFIQYIIPFIAIFFAILSFIDSRKAHKIQARVSTIEKQLKEYELEEKQKERAEALLACIEARVYEDSKNNYKIRIWNSGKATAYYVDYAIPEEAKVGVIRKIVPFEYLEAGKSFTEYIGIYLESQRKFSITTIWKDEQGCGYSKEQIGSI